MRLSLALLVFSVLFLVACTPDDASGPDKLRGSQQQYVEPFCGTSTQATCAADVDCKTGGCSGQVCESASAEPIVTTCDYRGCYDAVRYGKRCGCVEDTCQWR